MDGESLYVFGGFDEFGLMCSDLWEFSLKSRRWGSIQTYGTPPERRHHAAVVFEVSSSFRFERKTANYLNLFYFCYFI